MRLFIAGVLPQFLVENLKDYINLLKPLCEGVRWENAEKLHVTLRFLGEVDESNVEEISRIIKRAVSAYEPLQLKISRLMAFPNLRSPRVLYAGMTGDDGLISLKRDIDAGLEKLGFPVEEGDFKPHITLGRAKSRVKLKGGLPMMERTEFVMERVALVRSVVSHKGSKHTDVGIFELSGN